MSVALYRRYRSARFDDLIGQDTIVTTLRNEVARQSLSHAYLFAGIRGTGKTSTARILARAVNCLALSEGEPCNSCAACVEITSGAAVDVLEIDAASNRGIDEIRELRERVKFLPASLRRKVYIIDEAHMLTTEAWNAFLKTLEEPPDHVLFILATTEPHKVPDTVRSRVQRFDFRRVDTDAITRHLESVAQKEGVEVEPGAMKLVVRAAQGSVRDAMSLLDQALAGGIRPLTEEATRRALGLADPGAIREMVTGMGRSDAATALRATSAALDAGADPRQLLRELSRLSRALSLISIGYAEGADLDAEETELCTEIAAAADPRRWIDALELISAAEINLRQPVDSRLQVEQCLLRVIHGSSGAAGDALAARVDALERRLAEGDAASRKSAGKIPSPNPSSKPTPAPATTPPAPNPVVPAAPAQSGSPMAPEPKPLAAPVAEAASPPPVPPGSADAMDVAAWLSVWPRLIDAVNKRDVSLAGVLRDCKPIESSDAKLVVDAMYAFHLDRIQEPTKNAILREVIADIGGRPLDVEAIFGGVKKEAAGPDAQTGAEDATRLALETFSGSRITSSRLKDTSDNSSDGAERMSVD